MIGLPQYKDCFTDHALFYIVLYLSGWGLTGIKADEFQDLKLLYLNITKLLIFEVNSGQCIEYSTKLVINLSYMK